MYVDHQPCAVGGSEVRLRPDAGSDGTTDRPVGPQDGVVGGADETVDVRECTNAECPSRGVGGRDA